MWGIFGKPLKGAIWHTLGLHAVLMTWLRFLSVLDDACVACCLFLSIGSYHSAYKFTPRAVASPDAPQKPLVCKRARSGGAEWVKVIWHRPGSQAKKPRTAGLQQPACTHEEHQILSTTEATSFASQFWDPKVHPTRLHSRSFWPLVLTLIWKKMSSMHSGTSTLERGVIRQCVLYHTVEVVDKLLHPVYRQVSSRLLKNMVTYPPPQPIHF